MNRNVPGLATAVLCASLLSSRADSTNALTVNAEPPTILAALDTIGVNLAYAGDDNENGSMTLEYRPAGGNWRAGHPGLRVEAFYQAGKVARREFATRLFDLRPGTTTDVRTTFADPDGATGPTSQLFTVATRPEPVVSNRTGRTWHVSPTAALGGNGTEALPFAQLADAAAKVAAGDTILLHDGEHVFTNRFCLVIQASGTAEAPIVIKAADGARPVLRGPMSGLERPGAVAWRDEAPALPGVYSAPLAEKPGQVYYRTHYLGWCDTLEHLAQGRSTAQGKLWPIGTHGGWHWADGRLYVKFPARWNDWTGPAENPSAAGVQTVKKTYWGIMPKGKHIVIDGLTFRYFEQPIYLQVLNDGEGDNLVIRNCRFEYFNNGIYAYRASSSTSTTAFRNVLIDRCEFSCSPTYVLRDWTLGHDVYSTQCIEVSGINGDESGVIRDCTLGDCENGIFIGYGNPELGQCEMNPGWVIEGCRFSRIGDDSVEIEGPAYSQTVMNNRLSEGHNAISMAPAGCGPVWLLRNTIHYADWRDPDGTVRTRNLYKTPYGILKFNSGYNFPGRYILCVAYHNNVVAESAHSPIQAITTKWTTQEGLWLISRNNSFVLRQGASRALQIYKPSDPRSLQRLDLDYDNIWAPATNDLAAISEPAVGKVVVYRTLEAFQKGGYESHGISVLPPYTDPARDDLALPRDTPLRDAGVRLPGINDNFRGKAPDIGAAEQ